MTSETEASTSAATRRAMMFLTCQAYLDRDGGSGAVLWAFHGAPGRTTRRPNSAPAYYLGHPARLWITVMRPHRRRGRNSLRERAA
jgi:hypothetical protein